jgi:uncharacterized protein (DUF362 family)
LSFVAAALLLLGRGAAAGRGDPIPADGPGPGASAVLEPSAVQKARVVIAEDKSATTAYEANPEVVRRLVDRAMIRFSGRADTASAWRAVIKTQEVVGVKVYSKPGASSGTRPSVVAAVVEGLLAAGLPATNIIIWDKSLEDLRAAGFVALGRNYGVRVESAALAGYDDNVSYTNPVTRSLVFGDHEFGRTTEGAGRRSFVSKLVTREMTKIICVSPLLNHNLMGVMGCLASVALGSVDNTLRFEDSADRLAAAVPEIYAMPELGDRVALNIMDALICQYEGEHESLLHYSTPLNQIWISADPVALDVLAVQELQRQRQLDISRAATPKSAMELYQNAALLEIGSSDWRSFKIDFVPSPR